MSTADFPILQQERFARKNEAAELKRAFDAIDGKKDGKIDQEELGRLFIKLGHTTRLVSATPASQCHHLCQTIVIPRCLCKDNMALVITCALTSTITLSSACLLKVT